MKILVACEESQAVTIEMRKLGHEAYSCDIEPCSGGHPEWHLQTDALELLKMQWDMIIAHPPCTYMSRAGARWMYPKAGQLSEERYGKALLAKAFFLKFLNADCPRICVENPRPLRIIELPTPTQIIQPYQFGHPYSKATLLWLRGIPPLKPTKVLTEYKPYLPSNTGAYSRGAGGSKGVAHDARTASKTFRGIAQAMAAQWAGDINQF